MVRWAWVVLLPWGGCDDFVYGVAEDECPNVGEGFDGVREAFDASCHGCHGASPIGNDLDLVTDPYTALVDGTGSTSIPYVVPGDPDNSYLYQKITGTNSDGTAVMPVGGALPSCVTDLVRDWITSLPTAP